MRKLRLTITIGFLLLFIWALPGQNPMYYDSTRHFIKRVAFLQKNKPVNEPDTIFIQFKYQTVIETKWNYYKNEWESNTEFKTVQINYFEDDILPRIDSVFFREKYTITKISLSIVFNGGEKYYELKHPYFDQEMRDILKNLETHSKSRVYFELNVVNQKNQEQTIVMIMRRNSK